MVSLKDIRRRINSIENVEQITKSMEMIAAARFQRAQIKAHHSYRYIKELRRVVSHLVAANTLNKHPLLFAGKGSRIAIIVASADKGLCGAYNSNLFNALDAYLQKLPADNVELILFGCKAIEHYHKKKWTISFSLPDWGGKITTDSIQKFNETIIEKILSGNYATIRLVYTHLQAMFSRPVINKQLYPPEITDTETLSQRVYIFEPAPEELFNTILPRYYWAEIYNMLNQAYASELAARVVAMHAAAKNAGEVKDSLTLERNKLRQSGITREILEISLGADAT